MEARRAHRLEAIEALFADAARAADHPAVVERLSDAIAAHAVAVATELAARTEAGVAAERLFRTELWRVFEAVDAQRAAGEITDLDECYRIFAIVERLRAHESEAPGAWDDARIDGFRAAVDHQLSLSSSTPARHTLPGDPALVDRSVLALPHARFQVVDRVERAVDGWEEHVATMPAPERAALVRAMSMTRKEHAAATRTVRSAAEAGILTPAEAATALAALGGYDRDGDGWPAATTDGARVAIGELVAMLHDKLAGAR